MPKQWSQQKRNAQQKHIQKHQPWQKSTGPISDNGKRKSSRNADKGKTPIRSIQKMIRAVHKERLELLRWIEKEYNIKL